MFTLKQMNDEQMKRTRLRIVVPSLIVIALISIFGYTLKTTTDKANKPVEGDDVIIGYEQRELQEKPLDETYTLKTKGYTIKLGNTRYVPQLSGAQPLHNHVLAVDMTVRNDRDTRNHITLSYFTLYPMGATVDAPTEYGQFRGYRDNAYPAIELEPNEVRDVTMYYDVEHRKLFDYRYMGREEEAIASWTIRPDELD